MSNTDNGLQCRQIITKAVTGKGRKFSQATHSIHPPDQISSILGAWIINHKYDAHRAGDVIEVTGSYDINMWFSFNQNTKTEVANHTVRYVEQVPLSYFDSNVREGTTEVSAVATQPPNCVEAAIAADGTCLVRVEREFYVEMVGETKVCVAVCPGDCDDLDDKVYDGSVLEEDGEDFEDLDPDLVIDDLND
ncbi:spore coat protein E [Melghirimyces profundicolus]|uniref:Spore coat protein E n=1 Tax=Melghirimyces profundicolus TaxID=1242148 RepID=A0A2T6BRK7_9BACL|nr:outer spore coat protein CotE [Melghirimyces profundicolus]PTX58682.1 spore coat protein E [Melghirimyces profundicolus]